MDLKTIRTLACLDELVTKGKATPIGSGVQGMSFRIPSTKGPLVVKMSHVVDWNPEIKVPVKFGKNWRNHYQIAYLEGNLLKTVQKLLSERKKNIAPNQNQNQNNVEPIRVDDVFRCRLPEDDPFVAFFTDSENPTNPKFKYKESTFLVEEAGDNTLENLLHEKKLNDLQFMDMLCQVGHQGLLFEKIGVFHQDLNLNNIVYFRQSDGKYRFKFIDFGYATGNIQGQEWIPLVFEDSYIPTNFEEELAKQKKWYGKDASLSIDRFLHSLLNIKLSVFEKNLVENLKNEKFTSWKHFLTALSC